MSPVSFSVKNRRPSGANAMFVGNDRSVTYGSNVVGASTLAAGTIGESQDEHECRSSTHATSVAGTT